MSLMGVFDVFSASVATQHHDGLFVSGFGFAAAHYGLPDIGFIAWPDIVAFVQRLRLAFPCHHLLVDIEDGHIDPETACEVSQQLEAAGASGVILEDSKRLRRFGYVEGKTILPLDDYLEMLNLILESRSDLFVVARTGATAEEEILVRTKAFADTGADAILVDGLRSKEQICEVREAIGDKLLLFNQIAGGKSPRLSLRELTQLGVDVAIYGTSCLFAAQSAMEEALTELKHADGRLPECSSESIGITECLALLKKNVRRQHPTDVPDL